MLLLACVSMRAKNVQLNGTAEIAGGLALTPMLCFLNQDYNLSLSLLFPDTY